MAVQVSDKGGQGRGDLVGRDVGSEREGGDEGCLTRPRKRILPTPLPSAHSPRVQCDAAARLRGLNVGRRMERGTWERGRVTWKAAICWGASCPPPHAPPDSTLPDSTPSDPHKPFAQAPSLPILFLPTHTLPQYPAFYQHHTLRQDPAGLQLHALLSTPHPIFPIPFLRSQHPMIHTPCPPHKQAARFASRTAQPPTWHAAVKSHSCPPPTRFQRPA